LLDQLFWNETMHALDLATYPDQLARTEFVMIGVHGRDANKYAFFPFVRQMGFLHTLWLLPSAPYAAPHAPDVRRWFDPDERSEPQIRHSRALIEDVIAHARSLGVPAENVFLVGFSQGAVMAVDTALRYPHRLGGVVALSGFVASPALLEAERHPANRRIPIFLAHGTRDTVLPISIGRENHERLAAMGCAVEYHEYDAAHRISSAEVKDIRAFLHRHMYGFESDDPRKIDEHIVQF
jgi:phospholipase/carboxylesterase